MSEAGREQYVESLAAELYWAHELWLRRFDPYHAMRPIWRHLAFESKLLYLEMARDLLPAPSSE